MNLKNTKAIAFDLDGTLVDSLTDLTISTNAMRIHLGMDPLEDSILKSYIGDGLAKLIHRSLTHTENELANEKLWEKGFKYFIEYYASHLTDNTLPYKDVPDVLFLLKTLGYPLAVVTNKNEILATEILKNLNLLEYMSLVIGGDTLPQKKPSPLPLLHTAEVFNIQPYELTMVGDSLNDLKAANYAKAIAIGVTYGYEPHLKQKAEEFNLEYVFLADHFSELYDQFKKIQN